MDTNCLELTNIDLKEIFKEEKKIVIKELMDM